MSTHQGILKRPSHRPISHCKIKSPPPKLSPLAKQSSRKPSRPKNKKAIASKEKVTCDARKTRDTDDGPRSRSLLKDSLSKT